jgi:hypothetical protein
MNCAAVRKALQRYGLLLLQDKSLRSVAGIIAGEALSGSWWSHPRSHEIFACLETIEKDAIPTRLIGGKVTFVHRRLWPALLAVATAGETWQKQGLPANPSRRDLQERLLVHAEEVHTASGKHETRLVPWGRWAALADVKPAASPSDARQELQECALAIGAAESTLPWNRVAKRNRSRRVSRKA